MRAVILAGGKGRRLYPYTLVLPKPLVPIGECPIIEIVVRQLAHHGFDHITMAVGYQADLLMAVAGNGSKWGVSIDYSHEETPLSTIGPLSQIKNLNETFLVMNGDILTDLNYRQLYESHKKEGCVATIATCKRKVSLSLGVIECDEQNRLSGFIEKPEFDYNVSMGIYVFEPEILNFIPAGQPFGFDQLVHELLRQKQPVHIEHFDGHWLDMGTHEDLDKAIEAFEKNQDRYLP